MYLKSLEIFGFKSFPEKTILKFEPGITVVVGPNGCGKSNIFDAIKWALGEQSPKSLRGSKMEDVIFNGTESHPPLSYTDVTLVFSNEDDYLPINYKEVAVTRKLYRSGESEYYLNKNLVRLKDIQDLFLGTGIGEATYSFVEQGKIEILLSYKPEEKRVLFDEASGIVKYKDRKKETLKKLNDTEQNLLRLEDIINEVRRQIRYLERQVAKAKKYKDVEESLIVVEKKIATLQIKDIEKHIDSFLEELSVLKKEEEIKATLATERKAKQDELKRKFQEIRNLLDNTASNIASLSSKSDLYRKTIDINEQRIIEIESRDKSIAQELIEAQGTLATQNQRLEEEEKLIMSLDGELVQLTQEIAQLQNKQIEFNETLSMLQKTIGKTKEDILNKEVETANSHNELVEVQAHLKTLYARKKRLLLDREKLNGFMEEKESALRILTQELESLQQGFTQCKAAKAEADEAMTRNQSRKKKFQEQKIEKEKELVELSSYYEFLKDLRVKYGGFPSTKKVRIIFEERPTKINKLVISLKDIDFSEQRQNETTVYIGEVEAKAILFEEEELQQQIKLFNNDIELLGKEVSREEEKEVLLKNDWQRVNENIISFEKRLGEKTQEKERFSLERERVREEQEVLQLEYNENDNNIKEAEGKKNLLEEQSSTIGNLLEELKNSLEECQRKVASLGEQMKLTEIEITKKETEVHSSSENKQAIIQRMSLYKKDREAFEKNIERLNREKVECQEKSRALRDEIESLKHTIIQETSQIDDLTKDRERLKLHEQSIEKETEELAVHISTIEEELQGLRTSIYEKKLKLQELEFEKNKVVDYLQQVYNIEFVHQEVEGNELPAHLEERDKIKKKLDSLGEVNLVAIEEFEELNQRYKFLEEQKQDLNKSKDDLKRAIQKINRVSRQIFLEIFTKIRDEFKHNFRYLFGGGRAELILLDEDNVLESGVEIEVQPPGKKLQNVSLLSGGEKALTAISLIFAIFKVRPSPLCVLDEIDAPLDEANVDRFNQLMKEFSRNSQFILISHNKKTMSSAEILYGVTMQEKGLSKIVSVKFAQETLSH